MNRFGTPVAPSQLPPEAFAGTALLEQRIDGSLELVEFRLAERSDTGAAVESLAGEAAVAGVTTTSSERGQRSTLRERVGSSWIGRTASRVGATVTAALTFYGVSSALEGAPARADTTLVAPVYGTGSDGLWLRQGSPTGALEEVMPEGDNFDAVCWTTDGPAVGGYRAWLFGTNQATGHSGFASNAYLYTNSVAGPNELTKLEAQNLPECGSPSESGSGSGTFIGVDNTPNGDTITVPSNMAAAPWNFPTTSSHNLVDHVTWVPSPAGDGGETLQVYMTVQGENDARYDPNHAFAEAATDAHLSTSSPYWGTMQDQFICHAEVAATVDPNKPSWNLDDNRPDLGVWGDINAGCNPGGIINLEEGQV